MTVRHDDGAWRDAQRAMAGLCALLAVAGCLCGCGRKSEPPGTPGAAAGVAPAAVSAPDGAPPQRDEPYVVEVNGKKLLRRDLDMLVAEHLATTGMTNIPPELDDQIRARAGNAITEAFVRQTILGDEATRQKIVIGPEEVEASMEDLRKSVPDGSTYEEELQKRNSTEDQVRAQLAAHPQLKILKLLSLNAAPVADPTAEEIEAAYQANLPILRTPEKVRIRHIMVACAANAEPAAVEAARQNAEDLRRQLAAGADFAALAKEHSAGPSKDFGGDIGPYARGELDAVLGTTFDATVFAQEKGVLGSAFRTETGFHIVEVLDRIPPVTPPLAEVRDKIAAAIVEQKRSVAYEKYYQELKASATIRSPTSSTP